MQPEPEPDSYSIFLFDCKRWNRSGACEGNAAMPSRDEELKQCLLNNSVADPIKNWGDNCIPKAGSSLVIKC